MDTLFYYDPIFLEHDTGIHPERPDRLSSVLSFLEHKYGDTLAVEKPRRARIEQAAFVHHILYLESVDLICRRGGGFLDGDTPVSPKSFEAALYSAGAVLDCADALVSGKTQSAFALVRPPGHHARPSNGMGFCIINNIAVAAKYLIKEHNLDRILIVDIDVHHGNGTQEFFYEDSKVYFFSMHRYPFYPGTGSENETGSGKGEGYTLNLPVKYGNAPEETVEQFSTALSLACEKHSPQMMLVSAGFDAFKDDPVGGLGLSIEHYTKIAQIIRDKADEFCEGGVLSSLEGGYSLSGLPQCLSAYVDGLSRGG